MSTANFISLKEVIDQVYRNKLLRDVSISDIIYDTKELIGVVGIPALFEDKEAILDVHKYKAALPCDFYSIISVQNPCTDVAMAASEYIYDVSRSRVGYPTYKIQDDIFYTSVPEGKVRISYRAIKLDENGYPMLSKNEPFERALISYITWKEIKNQFYEGKVNAQVLQHAETDYEFNIAQASNALSQPTLDEFENITRIINSVVPVKEAWRNGFQHISDRRNMKS